MRSNMILGLLIGLVNCLPSSLMAQPKMGQTAGGPDGKTYRSVTFRFDAKDALKNKSKSLDGDFTANVKFDDGKIKVNGYDQSKTEFYVAGQQVNKPDGVKDAVAETADGQKVGLSWDKSLWRKMSHSGDRVYETTVWLEENQSYGYKIVVWDNKAGYPHFTKDPGAPVPDDGTQWHNSQLTVGEQ